jgi:ferredoxin
MSVRVRFLPSGTQIEVPSGTSLFDAADAAGLPVGSSCGADGVCGKCGLRVVQGTLPPPSDREIRVSEGNRVEGGLRLSCMIGVTCDLSVTADYW